MNLQELLGLYQQFSPEAKTRQQMNELQLENAYDAQPLQLQQLQEQVKAAELANSRVGQLTPLEVEAAMAANQLAARLQDPQVKLAENQANYNDLQGQLAALELDAGTQTLPDRVKRAGLENSALTQRMTLDQNRFNMDKGESEFDREMARNVFRREGEATEKGTALTLAQLLMNTGNPDYTQAGRNVLQQQFPQLPEELPGEALSELADFQRTDAYQKPENVAIVGDRVARLLESYPAAFYKLPPKTRLLFTLYQKGYRTSGDLTSDERNMFKTNDKPNAAF